MTKNDDAKTALKSIAARIGLFAATKYSRARIFTEPDERHYYYPGIVLFEGKIVEALAFVEGMETAILHAEWGNPYKSVTVGDR